MPTPRRMRGRRFRDGDLIVIPLHDTELQADIEAMEHPTDAALRRMGQFSERYAMGKMKKPEQPSLATRIFERIVDLIICTAVAVATVAVLFGATLTGFVLMMPRPPV